LFISPTETVFNESISCYLDFRIESDGNTNAFFLEGSSGSLGIGTSSTYNMKTTIAGAGAALSTGTGSYAVASIYDTATAAAGTGGGLAFQGDDGTNSAVTFATVNGSKENATAGNYASYLGFSTRANGGNLTEKVRIDSSGSVGIGTSTPYNSAKLDVLGSVISTSQTIATYAANNAGFDFSAATKVGRFFTTSTDATGGHMTFITGAGGGVERMRLTAAGNVGINNPNPAQTLSI